MQIRWLPILFVATVIAACGDGSTTAGGQLFQGTYEGTQSITFTGPGGSNGVNAASTFVVDTDGTVTSNPGTAFEATGPLSGNTFTIVSPFAPLSPPHLSCTGEWVYQGSIHGDTMSGTVSTNMFVCNGVLSDVSGTFSANKV